MINREGSREGAFIRLIVESEMPERYRIAGSELDVVFDDESVRDTFNLLVAFLAASDFKSVVIDAKIRY